MRLSEFRIECHQTKKIGKGVLWRKEKLIKDSDWGEMRLCRWSVHTGHYKGESLDDLGVRKF